MPADFISDPRNIVGPAIYRSILPKRPTFLNFSFELRVLPEYGGSLHVLANVGGKGILRIAFEALIRRKGPVDAADAVVGRRTEASESTFKSKNLGIETPHAGVLW
jgi:hypothetical protein